MPTATGSLLPLLHHLSFHLIRKELGSSGMGCFTLPFWRSMGVGAHRLWSGWVSHGFWDLTGVRWGCSRLRDGAEPFLFCALSRRLSFLALIDLAAVAAVALRMTWEERKTKMGLESQDATASVCYRV